MAETMELFLGTDSRRCDPAERSRDFLRRKFSARDGYAMKRLANAIGCTPKAAENLLNGAWPNARHFQRIVILFGRDFLEAVAGPDIDATVARLKQEESELAELLAQKTARRIAAEGRLAGAPQPVEADAPLAANSEPLKRGQG